MKINIKHFQLIDLLTLCDQNSLSKADDKNTKNLSGILNFITDKLFRETLKFLNVLVPFLSKGWKKS